MPFVRQKTYPARNHYRNQTERTYYYLVESYREGGKVWQRTLAYLGEFPTPEEALARIPYILEWRDDSLTRARKRLSKAIEERDQAEAHLDELPSSYYWSLPDDRWLKEQLKQEKQRARLRRKVQEGEASVRFREKRIARLQNLSEQLTALGYQCSAEQREKAARFHREQMAQFHAMTDKFRAIR